MFNSLSSVNFNEMKAACSDQQYTLVNEMVDKFEWETLYDGCRLNLEVTIYTDLHPKII